MGFGNTIKPQGLEPFQFPTKIGTLSRTEFLVATSLWVTIEAKSEIGIGRELPTVLSRFSADWRLE